MKTHTLLTCVLLVTQATLYAQLNFAFDIGKMNSDAANDVMIDALGNHYLTGCFSNTDVDFDPNAGTALLSSNDAKDAFVAKYDVSGNHVWSLSFGSYGGDEGNFIDTDALGNVYVTGAFIGSVDLDPSSLTSYVNGNFEHNTFIAKYDANGNYIWGFSISGSSLNRPCGFRADELGNTYVLGHFTGFELDLDPSANNAYISNHNTMSTDLFLAKYDANGNYLWGYPLGGINSEYCGGLDLDPNGNIYITGAFDTSADMDGSTTTQNLTTSNGQDLFIAKYDNNGTYLWAMNTGGLGTEQGNSIAVDNLGNAYIAGNTDDDILLTKYDADGTQVWEQTIGGTGIDVPSTIKLDAANNVYITGEFNGIVDFDPSVATNELVSNGSADIFIVNYTMDGNFLGGFSLGGSSSERGKGLAVDMDGSVVITGEFFSNTVDFDPHPIDETIVSNPSSPNFGDLFIARYMPSALPVPIELSNFIARIKGQVVSLEWITLTEIENYGFEVEHSLDGENWMLLDFVKGQGTNLDRHRYEWLDEKPKIGINYYRLKVIGLDASYEYTPIVQVYLQPDIKLKFLSNPVDSELEYQIADGAQKGEFVAELYNQFGQLMETWSEDAKGKKRHSIAHLPNGIYLLHIRLEELGLQQFFVVI